MRRLFSIGRFRRDVDAEVDEELRAHLDRRVDSLVARGWEESAARREAERRFGDLDTITRECVRIERQREVVMGRRDRLDRIRQDVRYALRQLRRNPGFALGAILTLALGIGANVAIFTVVQAVLLRPLPFPQSDRIVRVYETNEARGDLTGSFSVPDLDDFRSRSSQLQAMGASIDFVSGLVLNTDGRAEEIPTAYVTAGFFETLGVAAALGRTPRAEEERGDNRVLVLSHGLWRRAFGGDPGVIDRTVVVEGTAFRIIGVMPESFRYPSPTTGAWTFFSVVPPESIPFDNRQVRLLNAIGRLAPGATLATAGQELDRIAGDLAREYPDEFGTRDGAAVHDLRDTVVGDVRPALWLILGAVGLTLLIACVNVANLLVARGRARDGEIAVRTALGASRRRVAGQLLTESLVLAGIGGLVGVGLAWGVVPVLVEGSAGLLPRAAEVGLDPVAVLFATGLSLVTGLGFGSVPLLATGRPAATTLREGGRGGTSRVARRTLGGLVVAEVALATVLLIGAGLLIRSLLALGSVDPGFEPEGLLAVDVTISDARYPERAEFMAFWQEALDRMRALPGVTAASSIRSFPTRGTGESIPYSVPDQPPPSVQPESRILQIDPDVFRAMGIPVLRGTSYDAAAELEFAVLVNEAFERAAFGGENAVGREIAIGPRRVRILGVVGDVRQRGADQEARPTLYAHQALNPRRGMTFVLRTDADPLTLATPVRQLLADMDPDQPITAIYPATEALRDSMAQPRFFTGLMGAFAAVALGLAGIGIYGVVTYGVRQRTREIGLRMALGAGATTVQHMVLRDALAPVVLGIVAGLAGALVLAGGLRSVLFQVGTLDPPTYGAVAGVLVAVAALAAAIPALHATRIDPVKALRAE